ncbi:MAG: histidinol dehydrogenase [Deltaproteobacteria bacterium]|nr:histidinol dehydrogenase [Deltaproteobacteria bacterium]
MTDLLKTIAPDEVPELRRDPVDADAYRTAFEIVDDVRERGDAALREHAERLGDIEPGAPLVIPRAKLEEALADIDKDDRDLLVRTAERIRSFAEAQRLSLGPVQIEVPGGRAGHVITPVDRAGCYAPGGRFPLPSSVLMTAVTARAAGVEEVWVASPRPAPITLAAAAVSGAQGLLAAGGAQAIAGLAFGTHDIQPCDAVVGPGNRFVTAAKQIVSGRVAIDMLAGPSELVVCADGSAEPAIVAADLLAQAEHDPDALPVLVTTNGELIRDVNEELEAQLADLSTAGTATAALGNGYAVLVPDLDTARRVCDRLAPEHLELHIEEADTEAWRFNHYGGLFIGPGAAEVLGDYGAGPNHTLPTGGTARHTGGLSVLDFLRVRTWLSIDNPTAAAPLVRDAERLADLEGLSAHARAARWRL